MQNATRTDRGDASRTRRFSLGARVTVEALAGDPEVRRRGKVSAREFGEYVTPFLQGRRPVPEGSTIAGLRTDAEPLAEAEMVANLLIILFGGIETTESAIASAIWAALSHRSAARLAADDADRLDDVFEESLRWDAAVQSCTLGRSSTPRA